MDERYIRNPGLKEPISGLKAACSTDNVIVTNTVRKILAAGGNAIDAGIAAAMVQGVVEPYLTNHAGSVTALYYEAATGTFHQLDSIGTFPEGIAPFKPIPKLTTGYGASPPSACIPGFMPGLKSLYESFGTFAWSDLCADAVYWAIEGHPVSTFEYGINIWGQEFATYTPSGRDFYMPNGYPVPVGERFRSPATAHTMQKVANEGPDYMIVGGWADEFLATAHDMGWPITKRHMTAAPPSWLEPYRYSYKGYEVVGMAPPQQQGAFSALVLGILDALNISDVDPDSADYVFFMSHALRYGLYHTGFLGDPNAATYYLDTFQDTSFHNCAARLIKGMYPRRDLSDHVRLTSGPVASSQIGSFGVAGVASAEGMLSKQSTGSCELSIVDAQGNWLQLLNTLQSGGIPGVVVGGIPMVGSHATFSGVSGFLDAKIKAGLRMRFVVGSTFLCRDGVPTHSLGSPGYPHYTLPQVLTYLLTYNSTAAEAISSPRILPMAEDGSVALEDRFSSQTIADLHKLGVHIRALPPYDFLVGSYQMCYRDIHTQSLGAVADPRRCGVVGGLR